MRSQSRASAKSSHRAAPAAAPAPLLRLDDYLPYHLTVTANAVSNLIGAAYRARFGLSVWQWRVLCTLGAEGPKTAQNVVELSAMDKMTVSRAIQGLRRRGLVSRTKSKADARSYLLTLTSHGVSTYNEIVPLALAFQEAVLGDLAPHQRDLLLSALRAVREKAQALAPRD
ncbi:MAG: winged helix-turn-helix transcriptional regulator [Hyphomonadaceae bacterium]|nr:winged helix-turn-helix transcriptional regulator [Hyphomonadaceae bacterium]